MLFGLPELVLRLLGKPALGGRIERNGKTNGHFRTDTSLAVENGAQSLAAGAERSRSVRDRNAKRLQAQLSQYFAGVGWMVHAHDETSVIVLIVDNLGVSAHEPERYSPVATDRDRPCASAVAREFVKAEAWQIHILDDGRSVEPAEDEPKTLGMSGLDASRSTGSEELGQSLVLEAAYH